MEACTRVGCSVSGMSESFRTLPAAPEGVPAPHLYSETPTSVLLSWGAPEWSNGPLERWDNARALMPVGASLCLWLLLCECAGFSWVIERKVAGTNQVSTVGTLPADTPPLSFLDVSSALSPWTDYQYRLILHNQAGNTTGKAVSMVLCDHLTIIVTCKASNGVTMESWRSLCSFYRTLGRYHHQTISASWSRPAESESPGARLTSGKCAITAHGITIFLVVGVCFLAFADAFEYNTSEALTTFSR